jgi:hypothetical protein
VVHEDQSVQHGLRPEGGRFLVAAIKRVKGILVDGGVGDDLLPAVHPLFHTVEQATFNIAWRFLV